MANTVTSLSYANTFGDWMRSTNDLVTENNILAKADYTKDSGTILLSETTKNALQSNGTVSILKELLVQGVGSSATIDNNLTIRYGQVLIQNTTIGLINSGQANINGLLVAQGPNTSLYVANNASINGNSTVRLTAISNGVQANSFVNTATASITGTTFTDVLQANTAANTRTLSVTGTGFVDVLQANTSTNTGTASVVGTTFTNILQANSHTSTITASVIGTTHTNILQANTAANTRTLSVTGTAFADVVQANTSANTRTLSVTGTAFVDVIQANTSTNTRTLSVTGTTSTDVLQANTSANTRTLSVTGTGFVDILQANTSANTGTLSVTGTAFADIVQANTRVNTALVATNTLQTNISLANTSFTNTLQANTLANTATLSVVNNALINTLSANLITVNTGTLSVTNTLLSGTVQGNTNVITGTLSANTLVIAANIVSNNAISATNAITSNTIVANTVLIANSIQSNTLATLDSLRVNSAAVVAGGLTVQGNFTILGRSLLDTNEILLKAGTKQNPGTAVFDYISVNRTNSSAIIDGTNDTIRVDGHGFANGQNVYFSSLGSNVISLSNNTIYRVTNQNTNYFQVSTVASYPSALNFGGISSVQVTDNDNRNAEIRWDEVNRTWQLSDVNNLTATSYSNILTANLISDSSTSTSTSTFSNSRVVSGLYVQANNAFTQANGAFARANGAFSAANNALNSITGTSGSATPSTGGMTFTSTNGLSIVASGSTLTFNTPQDLRTSATPSFSGINLTTQPLSATQGGTGATSASAGFQALIYGHTGSYGVAGYVLATNGSGTYYWAAGGTGGGSGATPGTSISSSRFSYTANGASGYTGNSYVVPAATQATQVRAYINGVRQFESEYNLSLTASSNVISFLTTPTNGDKILLEVDGYYVNPYYANNIAYTVNATISPAANTIQLAIDGLASIAALKAGTTFTGDARGITMAAGTSNTSFATTAYVQNLANNSGTLTTNITGNAGSVTNGLYSNQTYTNPSWITGLSNAKLANSSVTINQQSVSLGSSVNINTAIAIASSQVSGLASSATTDTTNAGNITSGTLPNARLSGIPNSAIANSSVTINGQSVSLGGSVSVNSSISIAKSQISDFPTLATSATTDTTNAGNISSGTLDSARLATSGVTASGYGTASSVPTFVVDNKGRITSASNVAISITKSQVSDFPALATSATTDTTNASNITSGTLGAARLPYSMNQAVASTSNVLFNALNVGGSSYTAGTGEIITTGNITAGGTVTANSDERLKSNIKTIENALEKTCNLRGVSYEKDGIASLGVIAQEVREILPEVVIEATDEEKTLSVAYGNMVGVLIEAIKELKKEIDILKGNNK